LEDESAMHMQAKDMLNGIAHAWGGPDLSGPILAFLYNTAI